MAFLWVWYRFCWFGIVIDWFDIISYGIDISLWFGIIERFNNKNIVLFWFFFNAMIYYG